MKNGILILLCFMLIGCATVSEGTIGKTDQRRLVILGESVSEDVVENYAIEYNAFVFYTPSRGLLAGLTTRVLISALGPSSAMRRLMSELRSMSNTTGEWVIIIPARAERYFLVTLRNMEDGAVKNATGMILTPDSLKNSALKNEVARVLGLGFVSN